MKRIFQVFTVSLALVSGFALFGVHAQASAKTLSVGGVTVEYEDPIYCPMNGNLLDIELPVTNGTGEELLSLDVKFLDKFGQVVSSGFLGSFKPGLRKVLEVSLIQFNSSTLKCTDIAKMKIFVDFYSSSSKSDTSITQDLQVLQIGISKPSPTPTVTVTATPSATPTPTPSATIPSWVSNQLDANKFQIEALSTENKNLKAKLKKICASKPKPKAC
jgi:hypothetical protein